MSKIKVAMEVSVRGSSFDEAVQDLLNEFKRLSLIPYGEITVERNSLRTLCYTATGKGKTFRNTGYV